MMPIVSRMYIGPPSGSNGASDANTHPVGAEERQAAHRGVVGAEQRGVGVEHVEVVHRPLPQARERLRPVGRRASWRRADPIPGRPGRRSRAPSPPMWCVMIFSAGHRSNSPAKTMRDIATLVSYGQPNVHQISNCERSSRRIVGRRRAAVGMEPDRQVVPRHRLEQRQELRGRQRAAVDVAEELYAARPQRADRPLELRHRLVGIAQRQRRHEPGEALGMACPRARPSRRWRPSPDRRRPGPTPSPRSAVSAARGSADSRRSRP